jgi:hypothetical protein
MPLQNRVTPFGEIVAVPQRGTLMGNRGGCFHSPRRTLRQARWVTRRWIACLLQFRARQREVMAPRRYTELFFLDEATALAAGHRPCFECRRRDYEWFKDAWLRGNPAKRLSPHSTIDKIDRLLHEDRVRADRSQRTFPARLGELPDGSFVVLKDDPGTALLLAHGSLWTWTPGGYTGRRALPPDEEATVLTPRSIIAALGAGYQPALHGSIPPLPRTAP